MTDWWIWLVWVPLAVAGLATGICIAIRDSDWGGAFLAGAVLAILGGSGLIVGIVVGAGMWSDRRACAQEASEYETASRYHELSATCYLRLTDGTFVPDDQFTTLRFGQIGGVK